MSISKAHYPGTEKSYIKMYIRNILIFIFFFVFTQTSLCQENNIKNIHLLVPKSTASIPLILLARDDPLRGIDITVEVFINHPQAMIRLLRGNADLLFTGTSTGWGNRLNGGPIVLINTGIWGVSYLIGKDSNIKNFNDIKGKRLALPFPGSPLDFQTQYILKKNGIDPEKDLFISYSPFSQTIAKLLRDQVDVAPLPEPLATSMIQKHGLLRLIDYKKAWADITGGNELSPQVSLFSTEKFYRSHINLLIQFNLEWQKASQFVKNNPGHSAILSKDYLSLTSSIIETAIINTCYLIPSFEDNIKMVTDYYMEVRSFLPGKREELDRGFFFRPY